ncbi:sigma-70 family RNA polymerase sigma factor [Bacillus sp. S2(2024)]|uniref:sigma-70 family RNA polymerase sigma factor n=1 Tax=Bacillus sp. S2(2024) TaxID=3162887 RepID=UPI003D1C6C31
MKQSYTALKRRESLNELSIHGSTVKTIEEYDIINEKTKGEYSEIGDYKILSKKESLDLFRRYRYGETELRDYLFIKNEGLVKNIANRYKNNHPEVEYFDLVQEGNEGMLRAIEDFNPDLGYCFSTYAYWWIKNNILAYIYKRKASLFKIPYYVNSFNMRYIELEERFLQEHNRPPTIEETARILEVSKEMVIRYKIYYEQVTTIGLDSVVNAETKRFEISEEDSMFPTTNEILLEEINYEIWVIFSNVLNPKQRMVLNLCFGLIEEKIYLHKDIAKALMITTERVSQIKDEAIKRLKKCEYKDEIFKLLHEKLRIMNDLNKIQ